MNRRQKIIVSVTGIFLVLLILVGLTYAYFLTRIDGNEAEKSISVTTADLGVKYSENDPTIVSKTLIKPDTVIGTKEFIVTNTGNATTNYSIVIDEVENNFERTEDLEYVLKRGEDIVATGTIKRMETQIILSNINIEVGEENKHIYNFTVTYKEANTDQSVDMNKSLSLRLNIRRVSEWELASEGTLLAAIKRDNEVVDALSAPGKSPSSLKYVDKSMKHLFRVATIKDNNYYTYATEYKFDKESGTYTLINPVTTLGSEITENIIMNIYYYSVDGTETIEERENNDYSGLKNIYKFTNYSAGYYDMYYASTVEIDEAVLSSAEDDYGTSYYYRGSVDNNYVNFAGMCWRIVRVDSNGNTKLILEDQYTECDDDTTSDTDTIKYTGNWNIGVGNYGYDNSTGKNIMNYLRPVTNNEASMVKAFYDFQKLLAKKINTNLTDASTQDEINSVLSSKLTKGDWCLNDIAYELSSTKTPYIFTTQLEEYDYSIRFGYDSFVRLSKDSNKGINPTLKCNGTVLSEFEDVTGVSSKSPMYVGALTADEVVYAGAKVDEYNEKYYLLNGYFNFDSAIDSFWTISPARFGNSDRIFMTDTEGKLLNPTVTYDGTFRPVISLSKNIEITDGIGTIDRPYEID